MAMLHIHIDDDIETEATGYLATDGLTVSDAVRILLTHVAQEGTMPADLLCDTEDAEAYDTWFRAKVQEALDDDEPLIPHEQVVEHLQKIIDSKRKKS